MHEDPTRYPVSGFPDETGGPLIGCGFNQNWVLSQEANEAEYLQKMEEVCLRLLQFNADLNILVLGLELSSFNR